MKKSVAFILAASVASACSSSTNPSSTSNDGGNPVVTGDAGTTDAGQSDAGQPVTSNMDAGNPADAGPVALLSCANPPSTPSGTVSGIVQGNTELAFQLFGQLTEAADGGNVFYSPYSVSTALAMTYTGAAGTTASQMAQVLDFPSSDSLQDFAAGFGSLGCELVADGAAPDGGTVSLANALFGEQDATFEQPFLSIQSMGFGAPLTPVDFANNPNGALQTIDNWVSQQTDGMIPQLLQPGSVTSDMKMVLADALYFNQNWAAPFSPNATQAGMFHVTPDQTVSIPMMQNQVGAGYYSDTTVQMLELPFRNADEAIDFLLPASSELTAPQLSVLEAAFTPSALQGWVSKLTQEQVEVTIPKFKLDEKVNMIPPLTALGLSLPFSSTTANFSGIDGQMDLFIGLVQHEAVLEVGEQGVTAAAATAVGVAGDAVFQQTAAFMLDQPFLVVIRDVPTGSVLFVGQVTNPSGP